MLNNNTNNNIMKILLWLRSCFIPDKLIQFYVLLRKGQNKLTNKNDIYAHTQMKRMFKFNI